MMEHSSQMVMETLVADGMRVAKEQFPRNLLTSFGITSTESRRAIFLVESGIGGIMHQSYCGLPAAPSVEQAIILAQRLILKGYEQRAEVSSDPEGTLATRMHRGC
jgi:hypothetical protein